jgi:16S rRNA (guanine(966)-N(2))-methyltransferase RsmD
MRIISGVRKGHKLFEFNGMSIRPTTDRVKEAIFNLIQEYFPCGEVLDLFCGTGALAFEAVSRGACGAVCIDKDYRSLEVIRKNAAALGFEQNSEIIRADAEDYISRTEKSFDIIFLDPPYNKGYILPVLSLIAERGILSENGIVVLESDNTDERGSAEGLSILKQRRYGRTYVTIYRKGEKE